ncbi:MAG: AAA family ATPase [Chloroflexi bacterium]|nr:AAA family ATPase [Chloroflexota bacterium]
MRIDSLKVDGYGIFAGASIESLQPGLTLICGDNGAGKSTLLSFFRSVLFGHETGRSPRNYAPLHGGLHGGSLTVTLKNGERFRIARGPAPPAAGRLSVTPVDPGGQTRSLQELTDDAARDLYRNVFAFSLDELQDLQRDDAVGSRIYSAGTGARSAPAARRQLETEKAALFLPAGEKPAANRAMKSLGVLNGKASELARDVGNYQDLQEEMRTLAAEIQRDQESEPSLRFRLAHVQTLEQAWEHWAALPGLRRDLESLPAPLAFPSDGLVRLETLDQRRREYETRCEEITRHIADAEVELDSLHPDERLLENAGAAAELYQGIEQWRALSRDLEPLRAEARGQQRDLEDALRRPGPGWTEQRLDEFDDSLPARAPDRAGCPCRRTPETGPADRRRLPGGKPPEAARTAARCGRPGTEPPGGRSGCGAGDRRRLSALGDPGAGAGSGGFPSRGHPSGGHPCTPRAGVRCAHLVHHARRQPGRSPGGTPGPGIPPGRPGHGCGGAGRS